MRKTRMSRKLTFSLAGALFVSWMAGCGGRVEVVPVEGRVTFDGEKVPADGALYFQPLKPAEGYHERPGLGLFDQEGNYAAKTGTTMVQSGDTRRLVRRDTCNGDTG